MAERGAQEGNNNAGKGTDWRDAIHYELAKLGRDIDGEDPAYKKGLRQCASEFIKATMMGEPWALKELGDRTDGKSVQSIDVQGELSIPLSGTVRHVRSGKDE